MLAGSRVVAQHARVTTPGSTPPPFPLDGDVSRARLLELLAVQAELPELDVKQSCDLGDRGELVEVTKDLGAMMIRGGYVVVGVDDAGIVVGLAAGHERLFDEATVAPKIARYLAPGFQVRVAVHRVADPGSSDVPVALIWAAPHPDGCCLFIRNGEYDQAGKTTTAFRAGQVYARHGTRSEPAVPADLAAAVAGVVARQKEGWRAEHAEDLRHAVEAAARGAAPATATYSWQVDAHTFTTTTVAVLIRGDDIALRQVLNDAVARVRACMYDPAEGRADDIPVALDRIAAAAALALHHQRPAFAHQAVDALVGLYDWAVATQYDGQPGPAWPLPRLWLLLAERLYALGALAVRHRDWTTARRLALAATPTLQARSPGRTWHRHVVTEAINGQLLRTGGALLLFARTVAAAVPDLRPDLPGDVALEPGPGDVLLDSLCQFDLLTSLLSAIAADAQTTADLFRVSYPNYAQADGSRVTRLLQQIVAQPDVRDGLGLRDVPARDLAGTLRLAGDAAEQESRSFFGWEGYPPDVRSWMDFQLGTS